MTKSIRVLLVDDEELFVKTLSQVLMKRGMSVQGANNGSRAMELISSACGSYDVVLLDMRMPGMNGVATIKAIRECSPLLPVILLTGHADIKNVSDALKEGVHEVLLKPCPIDTLVASIENANEWRAMAEQLP